jgi:galactoside O-acetyltransferase
MAFLARKDLEALGFKRLGHGVRISDKAAIYDAACIEVGDRVRIDDFCVVSGRVVLGRNVHIAVFCNVAGGTEGVELDDFAGLAYGCHVFSQSDDYSGQSMTNPTVPARFKRETKARVRIGRHCILGTKSVVLPGVEVAEGCAVGAMSLVVRSTEPWFIYAGIPARKRGPRRQDLLQLEQAYLRESVLHSEAD